jgi:hypothetical protein
MSALDMLGFGGHPHHPGERFGLEDGEKAGAVFKDFIRHLFVSMRRTVCRGGRGVKENLKSITIENCEAWLWGNEFED